MLMRKLSTGMTAIMPKKPPRSIRVKGRLPRRMVRVEWEGLRASVSRACRGKAGKLRVKTARITSITAWVIRAVCIPNRAVCRPTRMQMMA